MHAFRDISIKRKLIQVIMVTSCASLLLVCISFALYDLATCRHATTRELSILAGKIGINGRAALSLRDEKASQEILASLRAKPRIVSACIYGKDGGIFAKFHRHGLQGAAFPMPSWEDSHRYEDGHLVLFKQIIQDKEAIGVVYLKSDLGEPLSRLEWYGFASVIILLLVTSVAWTISSRLQLIISQRILHLTQTAKFISSENNYSIRAEKHGNDEIGIPLC